MPKPFTSLTLTAALLPAAAAAAAPPADSIEYALAETALQVKMDLVLDSCGDPAANDPPKLVPTITVAPLAQASKDPASRYRLSGAGLASWWQKRDVALSLHDNGTLKSIGVTSADRTAAIVGNIFKLGTTLASLGLFAIDGSRRRDPLRCTADAVRATGELADLRGQVARLQQQLTQTTDPSRLKDIKAAIDQLAIRAGELRGPTGPLFLTQTKTVDAPARPGEIVISWDAAKFTPWFGPDAAKAAHVTSLKMAFAPVSPAVAPVPDDAPLTGKPAGSPFVVVREPVPATVIISPANDVEVNGFDAAKARTTAWIGQWGGKSYYQLRAGFGESKKLALELDPFGRKMAMTVNRDARAEAVTSGLLAVGEAAAAFRTATSDQRQQELRIKELETEQKYNKLMLCEAIIEEGGFTCP